MRPLDEKKRKKIKKSPTKKNEGGVETWGGDERSQYTRWCLSTHIKHAYRNAVVAATSRPNCLTP